jgi:hypothetical protein
VVLDVSSAENGVVRMQAQARGMLARKHDVKELAQASTVTKAEAKAERQRALGKAGASDDAASPAVYPQTSSAATAPADAPDAYEEEVFDDADGSAPVPGAAPASASANSASASDAAPQPAVVLDVSSAENGVVRMQAQARGMLARKHDVKELAQVDWSKGLGKGIDIPEYLWWKKGAHIQLKNLNKRATELFIMEIWKAKKIADAMKNEKADIHKFIMQHCQKKYGNFQNIIVENMASIMRAVEIHKEDADIEMFGEILAGRLDENVYTAQVLLILPYSVILPHTFRAC